MTQEVEDILKENASRNAKRNAPFNPITGEGSVGKRKSVSIPDFPLSTQYLPISMLSVPLVKKIIKCGTIEKFITDVLKVESTQEVRSKVIEQFIRIRILHDFCFWCAFYVIIKCKGKGDIHFILRRPQRRLVAMLEELRLASQPIRIIMLKARQWGGSTVIQIYMAWLQLIHRKGLNSLIVAQVAKIASDIKDMFDRLLSYYPTSLLHDFGEPFLPNEKKIESVDIAGTIKRIPQRNCKISIGTAEKPDSVRGSDYSLVHCSEVGLWKKTEGKSPEDIVRSACSGILLEPYTMIVYESTANGVGNFFQTEYAAAADPQVPSQFLAFFVPWYEIEMYEMPLENSTEFVEFLLTNRNQTSAPTNRQEPGKYLWWLWTQGATLENINWYILERAKYNDHAGMASEYPSNDVEAFVNSGSNVFDRYKVQEFYPACRPPKFIGDVYASADEGELALQNVRFKEDRAGAFYVWALPEIDPEEIVTNRYLVVVDIGGRSSKADFSVICVFDRINLIDGGRPSVVAQWYGHIDMDILAWKSAQIATFYDNALLVIESNTLETKDRDRYVDGDQSIFILEQIKDVYPNLYARRQSEGDIREGKPRKYGYHTNVKTKQEIISTLIKVIRDHLYTERDTRCLDEYLFYERKQNGAYGAISGKHDDLLMTRAIGLHICFNEMTIPQIINREQQKRDLLVSQKQTVSLATIS